MVDIVQWCPNNAALYLQQPSIDCRGQDNLDWVGKTHLVVLTLSACKYATARLNNDLTSEMDSDVPALVGQAGEKMI